jgi:hypothetical protein
METTSTNDWTAIAQVCPISVEDLPITDPPDAQARFLRDYLARLRAGECDECYDCYDCVERVLAQLEDAAQSPFMDA